MHQGEVRDLLPVLPVPGASHSRNRQDAPVQGRTRRTDVRFHSHASRHHAGHSSRRPAEVPGRGARRAGLIRRTLQQPFGRGRDQPRCPHGAFPHQGDRARCNRTHPASRRGAVPYSRGPVHPANQRQHRSAARRDGRRRPDDRSGPRRAGTSAIDFGRAGGPDRRGVRVSHRRAADASRKKSPPSSSNTCSRTANAA